jgi:hypothetical protein
MRIADLLEQQGRPSRARAHRDVAKADHAAMTRDDQLACDE